VCLREADVCCRRVELGGESTQTFLNVSIDVNKVLKFHMTRALSVNANTNYCIINTFSFSQSGVSS